MKEKILSHWATLGQREQTGVIAVSVILVLLVFYYALVNPLLTRHSQAEQALNNQKQLALWVDDKISQIRSLQGSNVQAPSISMPVNQAITATVARFNFQLIRLQPQQEDVQVWLQPVPFNRLLEWLNELEKRYAIVVKFIEVDRNSTTGVVEIKRLQLGRS